MNNKTAIVCLAAMACAATANASQATAPIADAVVERPSDDTRTLKGTVVDQNGDPVVGASVVVKGTSRGVITDIDGNFTLEGVQPNVDIVISYVGCKTVQMPARKVGGTIKLEDDSQVLNDVVVGYGSMRKRDVTTSISSVRSEDLKDIPATDFRQSLAAKMPGVQVLSLGGDPSGSGVSVRSAAYRRPRRAATHSISSTACLPTHAPSPTCRQAT